MKKIILTCAVLCVLALAGTVFALEPGDACAVIGGDLTEAQVLTVYGLFGLERGSVEELKITVDEERQYLEGIADADKIGQRSVSCVCIEILDAGSGLDVRTENITWCTADMYRSALATAGITDARVTVAAPWAVSGTGGMAGIYKAWETLSGEKLDAAERDAGTQELSAAAFLSEKLGSADTLRIIAGLKKLVGSEPALDGDALTEKIASLASDLDVRLPEGSSEKLTALFGTLKKLDPQKLRAQAESAAETLQRIQSAKEKAGGIAETIRRFFASLSDFFRTLFSRAKSH